MNTSLSSSADLDLEARASTSAQTAPLLTRLAERLNASPVLLRTPRLHVVWFGVFAALAAFAGGMVLDYYLWAVGCRALPVLAWGILGVAACNWLGARSFHLVALGRKLFARPEKYLVETGFYVQGGIAGITLAAVALAFAVHLPVLTLLDGVALGGLAALIPGRLGCFNYGCCYGRPTTAKWGLRYRNPEAKVLRLKPHYHGRALHPTQLYLAFANVLAFAVAVALLRAGARSGTLAAGFLVYHGLLRLFMERLRDDVNFNDGRNWFTHHVATLMAGAGALFFLADFALAPRGGLFGAPPLVGAFSLDGALVFVSAHPSSLAGALLTAVVMFTGYGLHGARLGVFPGAPS